MPGADPNVQSLAVPFRIYAVEEQIKTQDCAIGDLRANGSRVNEAVSQQGVTLARHDEQLSAARRDVAEAKTDVAALAIAVTALSEKVADASVSLSEKLAAASTRMAWSLTGATLTIIATLVAANLLTGAT